MSDDQNFPLGGAENLFHEGEEVLMKRYLLGGGSAEERQRVEENLLRDDRFAESLSLLENELIDDYARGLLSPEEEDLFVREFLTTPKRRRKLAATRAVIDFANRRPLPQSEQNRLGLTPKRTEKFWRSLFVTPSWKLAVLTVILAAFGLGIWRLMLFSPDQSMIVLNQAYRQQRPLESRISNFDYAPYDIQRGDDEAALKIDERALGEAEVLIRKAARENSNAESLHSLGRLLLSKKDFGEAIKAITQALNLSPNEAQLHNDLGVALLEQSRISKRLGDQSQSALEQARSLDELNKALELNPNLLEALFNRALCRQTLGLTAQAEDGWNAYLQKDASSDWGREAQNRLNELKEQKQKSQNFKDYAFDNFVAAFVKNDEEQAWQAFKIARARSGNTITDHLIDTWIDAHRSGRQVDPNCYWQLLDYAGSLSQKKSGDAFTVELAGYYRFQGARHLASLMRARQLMKEAQRIYDDGKLQAAADLFIDASRSFRHCQNEPEALFAESWSGYCQTRLLNSNRSLEIFKRLVAIYRTKNFKSQLAYALEATADSYSNQDELTLALATDHESAKIAMEAQDPYSNLRCHVGIMALNRILGHTDKALDSGIEGLLLANQILPEPRQYWSFFNSVSLSMIKLGYFRAAYDFQQEACKSASDANWPLYEANSLVNRSFLLAELKNNQASFLDAAQALSAAYEIADEKVRISTQADILFFQAQALRRMGRHSDAIASYEKALELYRGSPFEYYSLKAHEGCFLARLTNRDHFGAAQDLERILEIQSKFRNQIQEANSRSRFFADEQEFTDAAIDFELQDRRDSSRAYQLAENSRARSLLDLREVAARVDQNNGGSILSGPSLGSPLSLAEIQQRMPPQLQLVQFAVLDHKIVIWVVKKNFFGVMPCELQASILAEKVGNFIRLLNGAGSYKEITAAANELYDLLIAPVESALNPQEQLCIVPDKSLHALPFAALYSRKTNRFLIEDYDLMTAPSATAFVLCSEAATAKQNQPEKLLAFGDPLVAASLRGSFSALDSARREASGIAQLYRSNFSTEKTFVGEEAKESSFRKLAPEATVIHFATHAVADQRSPLLSRILLAPDNAAEVNTENNDGVLHAYELLQMRLPQTKLVVLSACSTGAGQTIDGEGVMSLARQFLAIGVPTVVATHWNIKSGHIKDLMISFHENRKSKNISAAQALRTAQLKILEREKSAPHPSFDWAAFHVVGGVTT